MIILLVGPIKIRKNIAGTDENFEIMPGLGDDGPSRNILSLGKALTDGGHTVGIILTNHVPVELIDRCSFAQIINGPSAHINPWHCSNDVIENIVKKFGKPDIVNFQSVYHPYQVALAGKMAERNWKYVVTPRGGLSPFAQRRSGVKKLFANTFFFRRYLRAAEAVVALGNEEAKDIAGFDRSLPVIVSPNGINEKALQFEETTEHDCGCENQEGTIVIGYLGKLDVSKKGLDLLLSAIIELQKEEKCPNLLFKLSGPFRIKKDESIIRSLYKKLKNKHQVQILGPSYDEQKWSFLKSVDVFVHTSRMEGMPTAVLEAISLGKPCFVTKGSNMSEIIKEAHGGWTSETSISGIKDALVKVSSTPRDVIRDYGRNVREYAKANLRWNKIANNLVNQLRRLA